MKMLIEREIEKEIMPWIDSKEIIAIRGPRQCGKTTFLNRIKEILIKRGVESRQIVSVNFENDDEKEKFERNALDYIKYLVKDNNKKAYLLFDEVQYIKKAGKLLKLVFDEIPNLKIIITGSSTLDINEVGSFLVGRVLLFEMHPLSFKEFLSTKSEKLFRYYIEKRINLENGNKIGEFIFLNELNELLKEYVAYGGYPAVVLEDNIEKKKILLKNLFETYIEKDIVKAYGPNYRKKVVDLIKVVASSNGAIINYSDVSKLTGIYEKELKNVLRTLEETYVIKLVLPFHKNLSTEIRKNPKVYFIDLGMRNNACSRYEFGEEEFGKLLENFVLLQIKNKRINYWRTTAKAEIDFVIEQKTPLEVKSMNTKITRSFRSFIETYTPERAFLLNLKEYSIKKIDKTDVFTLPICLV